MENEKSLPKLVLIEWLDSAQPIAAWRYLEDLPPLEIIKCASVGWLVGENEGVKMLAPNLGNLQSDDGAQGSGFIRIPTSAIVREVALQESV